MFKSIRWKITIIFVLLVLITEIIIGAFNVFAILNHYHRDFSNDIDSVFTAEIKNDLLAAANELTIPPDVSSGIVIDEYSQENINLINDVLSSNSGTLGITAARFYCILDGVTGEVLKSSNGITSVESNATTALAIQGRESRETGITKTYMDYALPLTNGDNVKYIVYIRDSCQDQSATAFP